MTGEAADCGQEGQCKRVGPLILTLAFFTGGLSFFPLNKRIPWNQLSAPSISLVWWIKDTLCNPSLILSSVLTEAFSHSNTQFAWILGSLVLCDMLIIYEYCRTVEHQRMPTAVDSQTWKRGKKETPAHTFSSQ